MRINHLLAVVPVSDFDSANAWYQRLFGRAADNNPMPTLVEWRVIDNGWVQVFVDQQRAGNGLLNFAVDDLPQQLAALTSRGLTPGEVVDASKGVQTCAISDPDGNTITLIGGFRVVY